jgi:3'(2'), 5'-bisphosphate nucleotidase
VVSWKNLPNGPRNKCGATNSLTVLSLRIITSSRTKNSDIETYLAQFHPEFSQNFSVEKLASAIKFFRILEGDADLYLHFRKSMEWDSAAGQALVELLGGKVKNLFFNQKKFAIGEYLSYKKPNFENSPFVISSRAWL